MVHATGQRSKLATTRLSPSIATTQRPVPEQAPLQPVKRYTGPASVDTTMLVPAGKVDGLGSTWVRSAGGVAKIVIPPVSVGISHSGVTTAPPSGARPSPSA